MWKGIIKAYEWQSLRLMWVRMVMHTISEQYLHTTEPLYSNRAGIAGWLLSTRAQNILFGFTVIHFMSKFFYVLVSLQHQFHVANGMYSGRNVWWHSSATRHFMTIKEKWSAFLRSSLVTNTDIVIMRTLFDHNYPPKILSSTYLHGISFTRTSLAITLYPSIQAYQFDYLG